MPLEKSKRKTTFEPTTACVPKAIMMSKKIQRAIIISYSAPEDVAEYLKAIKGKKSDEITLAMRKRIAEVKGKPEEAKEEVIEGLTLTEIKKKIMRYTWDLRAEFTNEINKKIEEARKNEEYWLIESYADIKRNLWATDNAPHPVDWLQWERTLTVKDVVAALGLPYNIVYYKIIPLLQVNGYKIVKKREQHYY